MPLGQIKSKVHYYSDLDNKHLLVYILQAWVLYCLLIVDLYIYFSYLYSSEQ